MPEPSITATPLVPPSPVPGPARTLLSAGLLAGPSYLVLVAVQLLTREGFDISRHPASVLSNGDQGWIQIGNFLITGVLFIAFAVGLRRVLPRTNRHGAVWGPRLIAVFGVGMVGAGVFSADPVDGFPPGTPTGPPTAISWQGIVHFLLGTIAFLALIAACFVLARHFAAAHETSWAVLSVATGTAFLGAWLSVFVLQGARPANVALAVAIAVALVYTSLLAARQLRQHPATNP